MFGFDGAVVKRSGSNIELFTAKSMWAKVGVGRRASRDAILTPGKMNVNK